MRPLDDSPENNFEGSEEGRDGSNNENSDQEMDETNFRPKRGRGGRGGFGGPPPRRPRDDDYDDYNDGYGGPPGGGFPPSLRGGGFPPSRGFPPFRGGPRGRGGFPSHRGRGGRRDYDDYNEMGGNHWGGPGGNGPPDGWGGPMGMMGPPPGMGPPPHMMMGPNGFGFGPPGMGGPPGHGPNNGPPPLMSAPMNMPPPGMMGSGPPNMGMPPPNVGMPPPNMGGGPPNLDLSGEVWVETKSGEGKSYYYNARTRETTWTKPEGPNVKIILQEQVEMMASQVMPTGGGMPPNMAGGMPNQSGSIDKQGGEGVGGPDKPDLAAPQTSAHQPPVAANTDAPSANTTSMMPPLGGPPGSVPPGSGGGFPPFQPPAFSGPPPFGMPPPGFPQGPWGMPPPMMGGPPLMTQTPVAASPAVVPPVNATLAATPTAAAAPSISAPAALTKDDTTPQIDPDIVAKAAEWSEHKAPDGRSYFYNAKAGESVWEKPQAMRDLETAKLALAQGISTMAPTLSAPPTSAAVAMTTDDASQDPAAKSSDSDSSSDSEDEEAREAERKRKEEEEEREKKRKEEEEARAAQDRSKPVSSTPVPGTPWCVVWTGDGRVFFYNPSSRTSVWERPEDLVSRADVDKMVAAPPDSVQITPAAPADNKASHKRDNAVADEAGDSPAAKKSKVEPKPQQQQPPQQAQPTIVAAPFATTAAMAASNALNPAGPPVEEVRKIDLGKEAAMEAEVRAARERAVVPLETRIASFRTMLQEKEVSAFSTWEKELHKIVFDPRYLLLTSKERKQVFEKYVKERAEEERKEKRNKMKEKKDEYRRLMEEANLHGKSSFSDFSSKFGKDDRFKNIEKMRERESLFNEYIIDVRRKEKEEKIAKREQVRKEFLELLRETSEIDRHTRYSEIKKKIDSDPRYKAVDSSSLREDIFRDYIHELKEERRRNKDKDRESRRGEKEKDRERDRKEKDKERGDRDKEGKEKDNGEAARSGEEDEDGDTTMADAEKDAEKKARQEASLREREKEVRETLAVHLRDRDNEREQHMRDEAVACFNALLADLVRNSELTWREAKRQLRKDHRWDSADLLDRDEKEKLFVEHIEELTKKKREKFRELLNETPEVTISSSWKDIRKLIKEDPRYTKFSSSDRKCEREFKDYLKDKTSTAKSEFRELLHETKLISHKSLSLLQENEGYMGEIQEILRKDKRFLSLEHIPEERARMILSYLEELEKRGPPPPPTASEPNRRNLGNNFLNTFSAYPKPGLAAPGDMFDDNN